VKPRLLFIGETGACRSSIAVGLARSLTGENAKVQAAAIRPGAIDSLAMQVMAERGIDPKAIDIHPVATTGDACDYAFLLCREAPENVGVLPPGCERVVWDVPPPLPESGSPLRRLARLRAICGEIETRLTAWLAEHNLLSEEGTALRKVWRELARYEHPLFAWGAFPAENGVEIRIRFRSPAEAVHDYLFQFQPREIANSQFPWMFQKQLYDCLHDYLVEMFVRNPQQDAE
jgi:protein-tyrosine-phosphatase